MSSGPTPIPRSSATAYAQQPYTTTHLRNFKYLGTGDAAPEIIIHHLWLIRQ